MPKIIEVTVSPTGETKVATKGYGGGHCREASKFIEQALGLRTGEQMTAECHAAEAAEQSLSQSQ